MMAVLLLALLVVIAYGITPGQFARTPRLSRNRRKNPLLSKDLVATFEFTTPDVIVTVDTPMVVAGVPQILTNTDKLPISVTWLSALSFKVTYDTPGAVTSVTIPQKDPGIRSSTGGWLAPGTFLAP